MKQIVVFDLDGTLALIEHRRHFVEGEKKDWRAFFAACEHDAPNLPVLRMFSALGHCNDIETWVVSGRSDEVRPQTERWLSEWIGFGEVHRLLMRCAGDFTPDDVLKKQWLNDGTIPRERVLCVFDDRDKVVAMWRAEGIACFQVAPGDF